MMKHSGITGLLVMTGIITGTLSCGKNAGEKGTLIAADTYVSLRANEQNNGKRFSIEGYPALDGDITTGRNRITVLNVYTEPGGKGKFIAGLPVDLGEGKNEFHVPEEFTIKDITVYDNDGKKHTYTDKLRFSFTLVLRTGQARIKTASLKMVEGKMHKEEQMLYAGSAEDVRIDPAP